MSHLSAPICAITALLVMGSTVHGAAAGPPTPTDFPRVKQVAKVFPSVTSRELDTLDGGNPARLPHCALDDVDDFSLTAPEADGGFWSSYSSEGRVGVGAGVEAFRFAKRSQAARSMRMARKTLAKCSGLQIGVESYSRYKRFKLPGLGDERLGYLGGYEYDFEPGFRGSREIVMRTGRVVFVVSASDFKRRSSKPAPAKKTIQLARVTLRKNPYVRS